MTVHAQGTGAKRLMTSKGIFIDNQWLAGEGKELESFDPGTGERLWLGRSASEPQVYEAVHAARQASTSWQLIDFEDRAAMARRFGKALLQDKDRLGQTISSETGKPLWETVTEVRSMHDKIDISIKAYQERTGIIDRDIPGARSVTRHKPHGVIAVFGPFNLPGHLPNGHIVPALLAGNTIVFKPSRFTPMVAEQVVGLWQKAGLPKGVINLLQGERDVGEALAQHQGIDGVLFTGSAQIGRMLHQQFGGQPQKILALEMGGNNPLIVTNSVDQDAAVYHTILSAYISAGQRCTCARRLYVPGDAQGDTFVEKLVKAVHGIKVGLHDDEDQPFMGPVISESVADELMTVQDRLTAMGGIPLVAMTKLKPGTALLSPGLMDVSPINDLPDEEYFGPFLQLIRYDRFDDAIQMANKTRYGLAAGLFCDDASMYQIFYTHIRAGIINWNRPLTGASSTAPFGGIGISGNHRPSAYYAADYCAYPVASIEANSLSMPDQLSPGLTT
jgi:succinylglutamic semialdehyde dehydrogenase